MKAINPSGSQTRAALYSTLRGKRTAKHITPMLKPLQLAVLLALGLSASAQTSTLTFTITPAVYYGSPTDTLALEHQTYSAVMSDGLAGQLRSGYPMTQFLWIDAATGRQFVEYANGTQVWGSPPQTLPNGDLLYTMTFTGSPDQNSGQPNVGMQFSVQIETQPPVLIYVQRYRWRVPTLM